MTPGRPEAVRPASRTAAATDMSSFERRAIVSASALHEYFARAYLLMGDVPSARASIDRARKIVAEEGTFPVRKLWLGLRVAEITAYEGNPESALQIIDAAVADYGVGSNAADAKANIALSSPAASGQRHQRTEP